jgi:plastocyanin
MRASPTKVSVLLVAIVLALFGLAACGDDDDDSGEDTTAAETTVGAGGGGGESVAITANADGDLAYDQTSVDTAAGNVTVDFDNPAAIGHDVVIEDAEGNEVGGTDVISQSSTSTSVDLQPGEYTFYCSVDGHRGAGMEGTLTVN